VEVIRKVFPDPADLVTLDALHSCNVIHVPGLQDWG